MARNTATSISQILMQDSGWLTRQPEPEKIVDAIEIDSEVGALDTSIYLHRQRSYGLADRLLARARLLYPNGNLTFLNSALNAAGLRDYERAIRFAGRAIALAPFRSDHRSLFIRICSVAERTALARDALRAARASNLADAAHFAELAQFIDFCEAYPLSAARTALARLQKAGSYTDAGGVANTVLSAVANNRPFSMIRLGDGEGAWLRLDEYDEGRFATMYRSNRISFLSDWFGESRLIDDNGFLLFAQDLQNAIVSHDLIGIAPEARLDLEEEHLSIRGIPASINPLRFLDILNEPSRGPNLCSNSVNLTLAHETTFYQDLLRMARRVGLITSQRGLADRLAARGIEVALSYVVPGDSRNFHLRTDGTPECQFPEHLSYIDGQLAAMDLRGVVVLVAAGFVGKRYLRTIRDRGGIAFDLGSLADHWARHGLPA